MFAFFLLTSISMFVGSGDTSPTNTVVAHSFHVVDFSLGFVSRVLPGAIFNFLFKDPTVGAMRVFEASLLAVVVLLSSYLIEQLYYTAPEEYKPAYLYVFIIFLISGCTFRMYYRELGILDVYWIYALLIFVFLLKSKKMWFLIPIPFVFMVAVNYSSFFCYIPLMALLILYKASTVTQKKEKAYLLVVFAVSVVTAIVFLLIFIHNEKYNLKLTIDQLHALQNSRHNDHYLYYDYALYKNYNYEYNGKTLHLEYFPILNSSAIPTFLRDMINRALWQVYYNFYQYRETSFFAERIPKTFIILFSACIPIMVPFYKCFAKTFKTAGSKLKKFSVFCMMAIFPFTFLTSVIQSVDIARWINHAFTCCFICFLFLLAYEKDKISSVLHASYSKIKSVWLIIYALFVSVAGFHPYL